MTDDLSAYFARRKPVRIISVCADCEVGSGEYHHPIPHPLTNEVYTSSSPLRLAADEASSHTIRQYLGATQRFAQWKGEDWMQADKRAVQRWLVDMQQRYAPATVLHEFSGLKAFFTWLESEGDIERSPFYKMRPPAGARDREGRSPGRGHGPAPQRAGRPEAVP